MKPEPYAKATGNAGEPEYADMEPGNAGAPEYADMEPGDAGAFEYADVEPEKAGGPEYAEAETDPAGSEYEAGEAMQSGKRQDQQPEEILRKMFQRAGLSEIVSFRELTEGFFNVAYEARDAAGGEYILKIAPPSGSVLMTHEKNIMWSEVHSMKRVREELSVPAAKILYYDPGCTVCDSEYFIMEKLPGSSFSSRSRQVK